MTSTSRTVVVVVLTALAMLAVPAAASAHCRIGGSGVSFNRNGVGAQFSDLTPMGKMNCASARYVMNKWLRRSYERSFRNRLPTRFYDGYVTWYCGKRSRTRWQCDEYDSGTSFRFTAYLL